MTPEERALKIAQTWSIPNQAQHSIAAEIRAAVAEEREACAKVAGAHRAAEAPDAGLPAEIAAAIRSRGA